MARSAEKKCLCVRQFEVNRARQAEASQFASPPFDDVEAAKIPQRKFEVTSIFGAVVSSGAAGMRKPGAAVYLTATDGLGMATVQFADAATGIREISRLLGLS